MSSKSVLLLGIVFVFLLNVVAVHNYINSYYYQPSKAIVKKNDLFNIDILKSLSKELLSNTKEDKQQKLEKKIEIKQETVKPKEEITKETKIEIKPKEVTEIIEDKEEIISYKSHYSDQLSNEKKSLDNLSENNKTVHTEKENKKEEIKKDTEVKQEDTKEMKKDETIQADDSEKSAFIILNLNVNDKYTASNPIIKKIVKSLDDKKIIKIKIYKYSTKIKNYLEKIKKDFAEQGIDMDDIKVIYNKNENKKNKIKILLTKKD